MSVPVPSYLADLGPFGMVVNLLIVAALLYGFWLGLRRTAPDGKAAIGPWLAVALPLVAWLIAARLLAGTGLFQARAGGGVPAIPFAVVVPVIVGLVALTRWRRIAAILDAVPPGWLIAVQVYRVFGGVFLALWFADSLPGIFALPAGGGDVLVGLDAIPVALYLAFGGRGGRALAYAWNILGITDLVVAVSLGFLTAPGIGHVLALDHPNLLVTAYPLVMIPAFAVPLSLILHGLSLWQLSRRSAGSAAAPGGSRSLFGGFSAA